jgi:hypothetical protein
MGCHSRMTLDGAVKGWKQRGSLLARRYESLKIRFVSREGRENDVEGLECNDGMEDAGFEAAGPNDNHIKESGLEYDTRNAGLKGTGSADAGSSNVSASFGPAGG